MKHANYAVLDCETGGLDPLKTPMTQFAIIILHSETLEEITRWKTYLKPYGGLIVDPEVVKKTTVTMEDIRRGIDVKEFVDRLKHILTLETVRPKATGRFSNFYLPMIVGHNVTFDISFLKQAFIHAGKERLMYELFANNNGEFDYNDTMKMAKVTWDGQWKAKDDKSINLTSCCNRMGVSLIGAHGAMEDTAATAELYRRFVARLRGGEGGEKGAVTPKQNKSRTTFEF